MIANRKFNPKVVDGFLKDFRSTLEFSGLSESDVVDSQIEEESKDMERGVQHTSKDPPVTPPALPSDPPPPPQLPLSRRDVFSLDEGPVTIQWPASIGRGSFEDLSAWLDILKRKIGRSVKPDAITSEGES